MLLRRATGGGDLSSDSSWGSGEPRDISVCGLHIYSFFFFGELADARSKHSGGLEETVAPGGDKCQLNPAEIA